MCARSLAASLEKCVTIHSDHKCRLMKGRAKRPESKTSTNRREGIPKANEIGRDKRSK